MNIISKKTINFDRINTLLEKNLETNQFTNYGPNVKFLEELIKNKFEINDDRDVVVVSNGSIAIHLLSSTIEHYYNKKIKWGTQSFTFPPSAQGNLSDCLILDIDNNGGLDLNQTDDVNGLIVTNIFGNCVDISNYEIFCDKNNKILIFDNAATSYTFYKGKNVNNYGDGCTISFHHTKPFGFGEGGAIILKKKYSNILRKMINFGIELENNKYFNRNGNNGKMSEISAVYIIQYLEDKFSTIVKKHQELNNYFRSEVNKRKMNYLKLYPSFHDNNNIVPSCFCILLDNYDKKIEDKLSENNIFCRKYYNPLKNTEIAIKFYDSILCVPCNIDMNFKDIDKILSIIENNYKL